MTVKELQRKFKKPFRFLTVEERMLHAWQLPDGCLLRIRRKRDGYRTYGIVVRESEFDSTLCVQSPNSQERVWIGFADPDHYSYWNPEPLYSRNFDIKRVA